MIILRATRGRARTLTQTRLDCFTKLEKFQDFGKIWRMGPRFTETYKKQKLDEMPGRDERRSKFSMLWSVYVSLSLFSTPSLGSHIFVTHTTSHRFLVFLCFIFLSKWCQRRKRTSQITPKPLPHLIRPHSHQLLLFRKNSELLLISRIRLCHKDDTFMAWLEAISLHFQWIHWQCLRKRKGSGRKTKKKEGRKEGN